MTIEKVLELPGNRAVFESLQRVVNEGRVFPFVGAGASAALYPTWPLLLDRLIEEASAKIGASSEEERLGWKLVAANQPHEVVDLIKRRVGAGAFNQALYEIFRPKRNDQGQLFTDIQEAIVRLPFRGIVTTNYDGGILEARASMYPREATTSFCTWADEPLVNRWLTDQVFDDFYMPVFYAHGIYNRPDSVVLGADSYRMAYGNGLYSQFLGRLVVQERLLFLCFGFSDSRIDSKIDQYLTQSAASSSAGARHFAAVGLRPGQQYNSVLREIYRARYNIEVVYYEIGDAGDHSGLKAILGGLDREVQRRVLGVDQPVGKIDSEDGERQTVLFISANPGSAPQLELDVELREIGYQLQASKYRDRINFEISLATQTSNLIDTLMRTQPTILHFSGHGVRAGGLVLVSQSGNAEVLTPAQFRAVLPIMKGSLKCIILSSMYSEKFSDEISPNVEYFISTEMISDDEALSFSIGFYRALGAGFDFGDAFRFGNVQIQLSGHDRHGVYNLRRNGILIE